MFLQLCRYQGLNPFVRDAYLIKFGSNPASIVVGKDLFTKRAVASGECRGWKAGIVVRTADGQVEKRCGSLLLKGEELLGGWAEVHRDGWEVPLEHQVTLGEYQRYTKDGRLQKNWELPDKGGMAPTLIRKVALVQALREAFPAMFQGLYSPEEMPVEGNLPQNAVEAPEEDGETIDADTREADGGANGESQEPRASDSQLGFIRGLTERAPEGEALPLLVKVLGQERAEAFYSAGSREDRRAVGITKTEASELIEALKALAGEDEGGSGQAQTQAQAAGVDNEVEWIDQGQMRAITQLQKRHGLPDERFKALLRESYGCDTIAQLTHEQGKEVIMQLQQPGLFGDE